MCSNCKSAGTSHGRYTLIPGIEQPAISNEVQYEVIGTDERIQVENSELAPFRYICQIRARVSKANTVSIGTGFFIGPKTILTVAHNVWDPFISRDGKVVPATNIEIIPARNGEGRMPFGKLKASRVILPYSDFKSSDRGQFKDYAIITIEEPKGLETGYFGRGVWAKDSVGSADLKLPFTFPCPIGCQLFNAAGYPSDKDQHSTKLYKSTDVGLLATGQFLQIRNDTYKSMSGCPVWIRRDPRNGGRTVVGFLLGAGDKDNNGRFIFNVARLIDDEVRKFIIANYQ
jgi:glutamyl endopeptidase